MLEPSCPVARVETQSKTFKSLNFGYGDASAAFASAPHVFREELNAHRGLAHSMEGRAVLARFEAADGELTVWSSTQMSHELAFTLAELLALPENQVRVIAPDVGGGFGAKYLVYPEEVAVAAATKLLGRPVKWIEDRREHFLSAIQERDQFWSVEIAATREGKIRGVRGRMIHDQGAYAPHSYNVPYNAATTLMGPYIIPTYQLEVVLAQTNKPPVIPVRGAGYPQSNFVMERLVDRVALELGLDRAAVRARNLIPKEAMPYETALKNRAGAAIVYDSGDYLGAQEKALARAGYAKFPARQCAARAAGRYIGIGIAQGVKGTGRGPFESATVRVFPNGRVGVYTGALAIGQGIKTALAQVCAHELGVPLDRVDVVAGDTRFVVLGLGGFASRQAITAGLSTLLASRVVRERAIKVAARQLEAAESDLTITDGKVHVLGVPDHGVALGKIALQLRGQPGYAFPDGVAAGLEATDSGKLINPVIAEGQIHGSIVHGIGNALLEWMGYDEDGQPVTTTLADYLLATAPHIPHLYIVWTETPSPLNPLGIKGVAESGIECVGAAIASAVDDALRPFSVRIRELPIRPARLLAQIEYAREKRV